MKTAPAAVAQWIAPLSHLRGGPALLAESVQWPPRRQGEGPWPGARGGAAPALQPRHPQRAGLSPALWAQTLRSNSGANTVPRSPCRSVISGVHPVVPLLVIWPGSQGPAPCSPSYLCPAERTGSPPQPTATATRAGRASRAWINPEPRKVSLPPLHP